LKLRAVGKYERCRFKAEADAVVKNTAPDFGGCAVAFATNWTKAERRGDGECPSEDDRREVTQLIDSHVSSIKAVVSGVGSVCGNAIIEGSEQCEGSNLGGADCTTLGYLLGTLQCNAQCRFNVSGCTAINCDPIAQNCAAGQGCYLTVGCQSVGTKSLGESCLIPNECLPGLACLQISQTGSQCVKLCDQSDPTAYCALGHPCLAAGLLAFPGLGICQP
jgi:hypothetical protein